MSTTYNFQSSSGKVFSEQEKINITNGIHNTVEKLKASKVGEEIKSSDLFCLVSSLTRMGLRNDKGEGFSLPEMEQLIKGLS